MDSNINMIDLFKYRYCLQMHSLNIVHAYIIDRLVDGLVAECWLFIQADTFDQTCRNERGIVRKISVFIYLDNYRDTQLAICKHRYMHK